MCTCVCAKWPKRLQLGRMAFVLKIGLPNAMPDILAGMRLSMTVALIVAVVGEMIASQPGLGQAILLAARSFRASDLFAGIALLGAHWLRQQRGVGPG
jgi:sulfonate transport system permease protein